MFNVDGGAETIAVSISGLTVRDGAVSGSGGGVRVGSSATLDLRYCVVTDNTIAGTSVTGGGIYVGGTLNLRYSTVSGNQATGSGSSGGGVAGSGATIRVVNSTISGNSAAALGGGLYVDSSTAQISSSSVVSNTAAVGGGLANASNTVTIRNTIIAGDTDTTTVFPDIYLTITSAGYNLIGNQGSQAFTPTTGDQVGTSASPIDSLLLSLADNGGDTPTHALGSDSSPAADAGNPGGCVDHDGNSLDWDQREYGRDDHGLQPGRRPARGRRHAERGHRRRRRQRARLADPGGG